MLLLPAPEENEIRLMDNASELIGILIPYLLRKVRLLALLNDKSRRSQSVNERREGPVVDLIFIHYPSELAKTFNAVVMKVRIKSHAVFGSCISVVLTVVCGRDRVRH